MESKKALLCEDLTPLILELILERLPISDYLQFAAVYRTWRDIQHDHRCRHAASPRYKRQLPWLMLPNDDDSPEVRLFYNPSEQRYYWLPAYVPYFFEGSQHGWLLSVNVYPNPETLFLMNPFTNFELQIPIEEDIHPLKDNPKWVLSSPPADPNCLLLLWHVDGWDTACIFLCKFRDRFSGYPVMSGEKFYGLSYEVSDGTKLVVVDPLPFPSTMSFLEMGGLVSTPEDFIVESYLVECDGRMLLIRFIWEEGYTSITELQIFKADMSRNMWERIDGLGNHVLLLEGEGCFISLSATDSGGLTNCIYWTESLYFFEERNEYKGQPWIKYDCASRQVVCIDLPHVLEHSQESVETGALHWIVPSLC